MVQLFLDGSLARQAGDLHDDADQVFDLHVIACPRVCPTIASGPTLAAFNCSPGSSRWVKTISHDAWPWMLIGKIFLRTASRTFQHAAILALGVHALHHG